MPKRVLVLGSTGSIGRQTLDVLEGATETHKVVGLSAHSSSDLLGTQARRWQPEAVCLVVPHSMDLPPSTRLLHKAVGLVELVKLTEPDVVVAGITGAAGLPSTLAAAEQGADLAIANKESLVLAGHLVKAACRRSGGRILPVDSEHSAIAQCLEGSQGRGVRRLVLTASGGPFLGRTREDLASVTVEQALRHPRWVMGPRISIDSATLMNKALEVIEACQLFDVDPDAVHVVVHPQSIIHSMVEYVDGSILAQLGPPDMRIPIRWALGHPDRLRAESPPTNFLELSGLTFEEPDRQAFPCLALGERVAREGGLSGCVLNAANEIAVEAFLEGRLPFSAIPDIVEDALDSFENAIDPDLAAILSRDDLVRKHARARLLQVAR